MCGGLLNNRRLYICATVPDITLPLLRDSWKLLLYELETLTEDSPYPHQTTVPSILWGKPLV